jgi:hypothetical protein
LRPIFFGDIKINYCVQLISPGLHAAETVKMR